VVKFDTSTKDMFVKDNIKLVMLKHTGEELVSYVLQNEDENENNPRHYYLFNPVKIINVMNPSTGGMQFLMSEWISQRLSNDEGFEVRALDILLMADVENAMKTMYVSFCKKIDAYKNNIKEGILDENEVIMDGSVEKDDSDEEQEEMTEEEISFFESAFNKPVKRTIN
jgi:hypothetical protein